MLWLQRCLATAFPSLGFEKDEVMWSDMPLIEFSLSVASRSAIFSLCSVFLINLVGVWNSRPNRFARRHACKQLIGVRGKPLSTSNWLLGVRRVFSAVGRSVYGGGEYSQKLGGWESSKRGGGGWMHQLPIEKCTIDPSIVETCVLWCEAIVTFLAKDIIANMALMWPHERRSHCRWLLACWTSDSNQTAQYVNREYLRLRFGPIVLAHRFTHRWCIGCIPLPISASPKWAPSPILRARI